ncbi:Hypothetical protein MVR_LOCUS332 [uncultured virus]|nr:Hypothetical protein MVR_LOCUS332 [uncultured virus]
MIKKSVLSVCGQVIAFAVVPGEIIKVQFGSSKLGQPDSIRNRICVSITYILIATPTQVQPPNHILQLGMLVDDIAVRQYHINSTSGIIAFINRQHNGAHRRIHVHEIDHHSFHVGVVSQSISQLTIRKLGRLFTHDDQDDTIAVDVLEVLVQVGPVTDVMKHKSHDLEIGIQFSIIDWVTIQVVEPLHQQLELRKHLREQARPSTQVSIMIAY